MSVFSVKSFVNETYYKSSTKYDVHIVNFQGTFKIMSNVFVYDIIRLQICAKFRFPLFLRFELFWVKQPVAIFTKMLNIMCLTRFWPCLCLLPQGFHAYEMFLEEEFSYWNIFWKYSLKFIVGYNFSKSIYVLLKKLILYLP